jgi:hypothetical protein
MEKLALIVGIIILWFALPDYLWKQKIKYRSRYWFHKLIGLFGWCADCKEKLNVASSGSKFCPNCKKRKY